MGTKATGKNTAKNTAENTGENTAENTRRNEKGSTTGQSARDRLRAEREREAKRGRVRRQFTVAGAVVAVLALATGIGVALADSGGGSGAKDSAAAKLPLTVPAAAAASAEDGTVITYGDKKAKNTLTIYEDPRCPYCALFEQANGDTVKKLADQGRFKVEYRFATFLDDALGGQGSKRALNALGAAADQGSGPFLALHKVLYANHPDEHDDAYASTGHLLDLAGKVDGLRNPAFDKAVKDLTYMPWVNKVGRAFDAGGVKGTPTVLLNGRKLPVLNERAQSVTPQQFTALVDKELGGK
ncbi:DsbA family protein [Wenjunlia tyrosinilytica]|uniref:Membrane protein n=1 Tax=Wenjunlia tyrosinilytica TaxID=1544741 RepID=A0A917ZFW9_9ACTN|nr:thioredoxin domain-containing protein [Wenjunlia tyrosinilytica]GGO81727.1 membrane protein [Wenjunlia tyrosinilytica]